METEVKSTKHFFLSKTFMSKIKEISQAFSPQSSILKKITANPHSEVYQAYMNLPVPWQTPARITRIINQADEISQYPEVFGQEMINFLVAYGVESAEKNRFYGLCNKQYGYEQDILTAHAQLQNALLQERKWANETLYEAYCYGWHGYEQNIDKAKSLLEDPFPNKTALSSGQRKSSKRRKGLSISSHLSAADKHKLIYEFFGLPPKSSPNSLLENSTS
jgi:hypothetical protein